MVRKSSIRAASARDSMGCAADVLTTMILPLSWGIPSRKSIKRRGKFAVAVVPHWKDSRRTKDLDARILQGPERHVADGRREHRNAEGASFADDRRRAFGFAQVQQLVRPSDERERLVAGHLSDELD